MLKSFLAFSLVTWFQACLQHVTWGGSKNVSNIRVVSIDFPGEGLLLLKDLQLTCVLGKAMGIKGSAESGCVLKIHSWNEFSQYIYFCYMQHTYSLCPFAIFDDWLSNALVTSVFFSVQVQMCTHCCMKENCFQKAQYSMKL